jgi:polyisoprenoid-binding protein YceI
MQQTQQLGTTVWSVDPTHTTVEFAVKHMMFTTVRGRFGEATGEIVIDEADFSASRVAIDIPVATIDTRTEQRDAHLRSADFFDAENHPLLTFRSRRVAGDGREAGSRFRVVGDLTIRGETREVVLDVVNEGRGTDPWGGQRIGFSAEAKIDRTDFGLTWNQALETGGVLVSNEIRIRLEIQAVESADS